MVWKLTNDSRRPKNKIVSNLETKHTLPTLRNLGLIRSVLGIPRRVFEDLDKCVNGRFPMAAGDKTDVSQNHWGNNRAMVAHADETLEHLILPA